MEKLNKYEQLRALRSLESMANGLSILAEDIRPKVIKVTYDEMQDILVSSELNTEVSFWDHWSIHVVMFIFGCVVRYMPLQQGIV